MIPTNKSARILLFTAIGLNFGVGIGVGTVLVKTRPEVFALRPVRPLPARGLASQRPDSRGNSTSTELDAEDVCTDLSLVPTSRLKQEYDKRTTPSMLADLVNDRFAPPRSTDETLSTARVLLDRLQPFYSEVPYWKGETSLVTDELAVPLEFELKTGGAESEESFAVNLHMSEKLSEGVQRSTASVSDRAWQVRDMRFADDRAFVVLDVQGELLKKLKGKYTRLAVTLPEPGAEDGWVEMLDIDTGKWVKSDRVLQWLPATEGQ